MARCEHLSWLQISGTQQHIFHDEGRLGRILLDLTNPIHQRPSVLFFVGRKAKNVALRELFPYNNIVKARQDGVANLRIDTTTTNSDYPILFADSDTSQDVPPQIVDCRCHEFHSYSVRCKSTAACALVDLVHARLFFLFADVICIFADDFLSLQDMVCRLKNWATAGRVSVSPHSPRPKLVIVIRGDESTTYNILLARDLEFDLSQGDIEFFFSSVVVLYLEDGQLSSLARHRRLKEVLLRQADEMRHARQDLQCLYSAIHLNRFFQAAVKHLAQKPDVPFGFIHASRQQNPVLVSYRQHISSFVHLSNQAEIPSEGVASIIASSILMDAYPPNMHGKF